MKRYPWKEDRVLVCGHRGLRIYGIENTMAAFRMAIGCGVDMIETDVRLTKDGHPILMHDRTADRTTNGKGRIRDLTLAEIEGFDATVHKTVDIASEPPPTFAAFLSLMEAHPHILLNVELKDYPEEDEKTAYLCADTVCDMILARGLAGRSFINSFSGKLLAYVYKKHGNAFFYHGFYPWFILGPMETDPESFIDVACMQHRMQLEDKTIQKCENPLCPEEWFTHLKSKGIMPLMAPSLKEFSLYDLAFSYGSRIVNTDDPEAMLVHLRKSKLHD